MSVKNSEKKVVSRRIVIVLGIICVILLVGLVGSVLVYSSKINDRNNAISTLNKQVTSKDSAISSLSSQVANLTSIVNLTRSVIWVNFENVSILAGYETVWNASAKYAGYVSVQIFSSTSSYIYVSMTYSSYGVEYGNKITVGEGGSAVFPVLPASLVQISVGNPDTVVATMTVTITYYY